MPSFACHNNTIISLSLAEHVYLRNLLYWRRKKNQHDEGRNTTREEKHKIKDKDTLAAFIYRQANAAHKCISYIAIKC